MTWTARFLLALGLSQMAADAAHLAALRGLAAATCAAPAPKVFSSVRTLETFSTKFSLAWRDRAGGRHGLEITPELYARLRGPYNRRNVYGAVLAFGPVLVAEDRTRPLFEAVAHFALAGDAPLLRDLGVDPSEVCGPVRVRWEPREGTAIGLPLEVEVP